MRLIGLEVGFTRPTIWGRLIAVLVNPVLCTEFLSVWIEPCELRGPVLVFFFAVSSNLYYRRLFLYF